MPVLGGGGGSSASTSSSKKGVYIPSNWGATWKAARNAHASALTDVVIWGDSTTYGSAYGTPTFYSWVQKLRALSIAAGYTDGGRGIAGQSDTVGMSAPDNLNVVQSNTGFGSSGDGNDFLLTETPESHTAGDTITLQGYGTAARLYYTKIGVGGNFTYSVNGGSANTVNSNYSGFSVGVIYLPGLSGNPNTVTIVNTSGASVRVIVEFFKSTGIVYHKQAISGISSGSFFGRSNPNNGNYQAQAALGLVPGVGGGIPITYGWGQPKGANPLYRNVSLSIWALGINNMQGTSLASDGSPTTTEQDSTNRGVSGMENDMANFVRLSKAVGADPLVVVPHFELAQNNHTYGGQFIRSAWNTGVALGCAVVDFNEVVRPVSTMIARGLGTPAVHAPSLTYDAEAQFLWDNCLSL